MTMRNLRLLHASSWTPPFDLPPSPFSSLDVVEEMDDKSVLLCRGNLILRLHPESGHHSRLDLAREVALDPSERLVAVRAVFDDELLLVTSHRAFRSSTRLQGVECVREFAVEVLAAEWSPNLDLVALVTADDRLSVASGDELMERAETDLLPEHFGRAQLVDVGWGKKETQFHGSEGKAAALKKIQPTVGLSPYDSSNIGISWQSDSELFAVSTLAPDSSRRLVRVWTADLELHSTSEHVPVTSAAPEGACLAWRGSTNRIAVAARRALPNAGPEVVLYERNGLQHRQDGGRFVVETEEEGKWRIEALEWNGNMDVIAVGLERTDGEKGCEKVQLWTIGNRHWYRKYEMDLSGDGAVALRWDPTETFRLHILTKAGRYHEAEWTWSVDRSESEDSAAWVSVIDGACLLLTPFRSLCIPPPMSALSLPFSHAVLQCSLSCHSLAVHLADGSLLVGRLSVDSGDPACLTTSITGVQLSHTATHLTWQGEDQLVTVEEKEVLQISWKDGDSQISRLPLPQDCCTVNGLVFTQGRLWAQGENGTVWARKDGEWRSETKLPGRCDQWTVVGLRSCSAVVGLQSNLNRLCINGEVLLNGCTSFAIHDRFLLSTSSSNKLLCLPLHRCDNAEDVGKEMARMSVVQETCVRSELVRVVERGSVIVTAVSHDAKVVLQLPRGNLETVFPRALLLDTVRRLLDNGDIRAAYLLMRRHRVNMNVLFDHNRQRFLNEADTFVTALGSPDDVNQVLSELSEEDVTQTLYADVSSRENNERACKEAGKVNAVIDALEAVLTSLGDQFLSCRVTCCAKRRPSSLQQALVMIVERHKSGACEEKEVETALRTLTYHVSTPELYKLALRTYDFSVITFVLDNSSLDPREHLPFLEELRSFAEDYRRFRIDAHTEHFTSAISHLLPSRDAVHFEEALAIVRQHDLFPAALALYPRDQTFSDEYKTLSRAFAERLRAEGGTVAVEAAGNVLLRCGEARQARRCFLGAGKWRKWRMAVQMSGRDEEVEEEAKSLAGSLRSRGDAEAAANLIFNFTDDCEAAITLAADSGCWEVAQGLAHEAGRTELLERIVLPSVRSAAVGLEESMCAVKDEVETRADRLAIVRAELRRREVAMMEAEDEAPGADLFSDASSVPESTSSAASSRSSGGRTSKSRRKAERKRWTLKEGSKFEEVALLERLYQLAERSNRFKGEVAALGAALVDFSLPDVAFRLTRQCQHLLSLLRRRRDEIWWETANKKEEALSEHLSTHEAMMMLRGDASTRRRYPDIQEVFLLFPPVLDTPPLPTSLMYCPYE